jgi:hypothetical protein
VDGGVNKSVYKVYKISQVFHVDESLRHESSVNPILKIKTSLSIKG